MPARTKQVDPLGAVVAHFWMVRNGCPIVPALASLPLGATMKSAGQAALGTIASVRARATLASRRFAVLITFDVHSLLQAGSRRQRRSHPSRALRLPQPARRLAKIKQLTAGRGPKVV